MADKKVLALIPARSGSKSVTHKNIRQIAGKPMIAYSIEHAIQSKYINRIVVSTDSEEYAAIAREHGAETPFLRPAEYATDTALDIEVFEHALRWLREKEGYEPDVIVQLRPTYPIRNVADIDTMIEMMLNDPEIDCVRTLAPATEVAHKMWYMGENGRIRPILTDIPEAYNMARQMLPRILYQNGNVDVIRPRVIVEEHSMSGKHIVGYEMKDNFDIDTTAEFEKAAQYLTIKTADSVLCLILTV